MVNKKRPSLKERLSEADKRFSKRLIEAVEETKRRGRILRKRVEEVVEKLREPSPKKPPLEVKPEAIGTVRVAPPEVELKGVETLLAPEPTEKVFIEKKEILAREAVRRESLRSATVAIKEFEEELEKKFKPVEAQVKEFEGKFLSGKTFRITTEAGGPTKRVTLEKLRGIVSAQKAKEREKFLTSLEEGIEKFETKETARLIRESPELRAAAFQETLKVTTGAVTGLPRPEFARPEVKARLPTVKPLEIPRVRQRVGVAVGKAVGQLFVPTTEAQRMESERLGIAAIRGATFGLLAPEFEPMTTEEALFIALAGTASAEFVVAPIVSKALTFVAKRVPSVKKAPFVREEFEEVIRFEPVFKEETFDIIAQELTGVRVGAEETAVGTAFGFPSKEPGAISLADEAAFFRFSERFGGAETIQAGIEQFGGRQIFFGKPTLELPTPFEFEIFAKTGRAPVTLPVLEIRRIKQVFPTEPGALIKAFEEGIDVEKFLVGQLARPERAVEVFTEKRIPVGSKLFEERKRIFELVSPAVRGETPKVKVIFLGPGKGTITRPGIKFAAREIGKFKPEQTIIDIPRLFSAGAAEFPIVIQVPRGVKELEATRIGRVGALMSTKIQRITGFRPTTVKELKLVVEAPPLLITKVGTLTKVAVAAKIRTAVATKVGVFPAREIEAIQQRVLRKVKELELQKVGVRQRIDIAITPIVKVKTKTKLLQVPIQKARVPTMEGLAIGIRIPSFRLGPRVFPFPRLIRRELPRISIRRPKRRKRKVPRRRIPTAFLAAPSLREVIKAGRLTIPKQTREFRRTFLGEVEKGGLVGREASGILIPRRKKRKKRRKK